MRSQLNRIKNWEQIIESAGYKVGRVATASSVCDRQLRRWVHLNKGMKVQVWFREVRLRNAPSLLQSGLSVKEVAALLHYSDHSQFSRDFKRHFGVPPSHFNIVAAQNAIPQPARHAAQPVP